MESVYYREAVFYSAAEVGHVLEAPGFVARDWGQTLFHPLHESKEIELVRSGTGESPFVAVMAERSNGVPVQEKPPKQYLWSRRCCMMKNQYCRSRT